MTTKLFALISATAIALALAAPAAAQGRQTANEWSAVRAFGEWSAVQSLSPGEKIVVRTKDGDKLSGRFDSADGQSINFTRDGKRVTLTRESVGRIQRARGRNRLKGALVGAGVGGGTGAAAGGYVVARSDHFGGTPLPVGIAVGAGVGATVGAALGLGTNYETIYEAR